MADDSQQRYDTRTKEEKKPVKQKLGMGTTLVIFAILLLLIAGVFFVLRNLMPGYQFNQGKKYMDLGQYDKALNMFEQVANAKPYDNEPIYYQTLALSKMPPTYENQKKLYEISQLDDCDEASELADSILMNMRNNLDKQLGPNYADNILYNDLLIRWNASNTIDYAVIADSGVPEVSVNAVKDVFSTWGKMLGGKLQFHENGVDQADIVIRFADDITLKDKYDPNRLAKTVPDYKGNVLKKMNIYLKKTEPNGTKVGADKLYNLALHSVGHALGIGGHSADPNDIMYYIYDTTSTPGVRKTVSQRDLNTISILYNMLPDVIDTPISPSDYHNLYYHELFTAYPGQNFELETQRLISQIKANGRDIVAWVDLAINYGLRKQYARSNYILAQALPLVQNDLRNQFVILYNLAVNYYKLRDYKTSEKHLNLAKTMYDDMDTQILETFLDVRFKRYNIAKEKLNLLIKKYPKNIEVALKLAEVYHFEKNQKMEKEVIESLLKRNPDAIRDRRVLKYRANKSEKKETVVKK